MKIVAILKYEWIHFIRSPFKIIAVVLFVLASLYGLHNASSLYHTQTAEIEAITSKAQESKAEILGYFDTNQKGPEGRPWVDVTTPFWAMWYANLNHFKTPSPLMVYGIGQAEQYGYYKRVTFTNSPYDADMVEEIANPERLQMGHLDFSFSIIYLLPLLLMIWLYNIKGAEMDSGIITLITVQATHTRSWLWLRIGFYAVLISLLITVLFLYGGRLTTVFESNLDGFFSFWLWAMLYLVFWVIVFGLVIHFGSASTTNTLKMVGLWLVLTFIVPGTVHQWISTQYPANLMTDFIDAQRNEKDKLYALPDAIFQQKLNEKFPEILNSVAMKDSLRRGTARNESAYALVNELTKSSLKSIEASYRQKNQAIEQSYWLNPVTLFQNKFNRITTTHFDDYQNYRDEIQQIIDHQIEVMVMDIWNAVVVDKKRYLEYVNLIDNMHQ